jgi:hypothetical protein
MVNGNPGVSTLGERQVDAFLISESFNDIIAAWGSFGILVRLPLSWSVGRLGN